MSKAILFLSALTVSNASAGLRGVDTKNLELAGDKNQHLPKRENKDRQLDTLPNGSIMVDQSGRCLTANPHDEAGSYFFMSMKECDGTNHQRFFVDDQKTIRSPMNPDYCLDWNPTNSPPADRGWDIIMKPCDGSRQQEWDYSGTKADMEFKPSYDENGSYNTGSRCVFFVSMQWPRIGDCARVANLQASFEIESFAAFERLDNSSDDPNDLANNPLIFTGHLDWDPSLPNWYPVTIDGELETIDVNDLQDVETKCYSRCLADAQCTAIEFNLDTETTGNGRTGCWLWKGVPRFVEKEYGNQDAGIWLKKNDVSERDLECDGDCDLTKKCSENRFRGFSHTIFEGCGLPGRVCELYHGWTCSWVAVKYEW